MHLVPRVFILINGLAKYRFDQARNSQRFHKGGQVSKETVVLRRWEYHKIIWFYQLG